MAKLRYMWDKTVSLFSVTSPEACYLSFFFHFRTEEMLSALERNHNHDNMIGHVLLVALQLMRLNIV